MESILNGKSVLLPGEGKMESVLPQIRNVCFHSSIGVSGGGVESGKWNVFILEKRNALMRKTADTARLPCSHNMSCHLWQAHKHLKLL